MSGKKNLKILLIDDSEQELLIGKRAFGKSDEYEVICEADADCALQTMTGHGGWRPDLVLVDIKMPKMSGIEFVAKAKKSERLCEVPILIMTSSKDRQDVLGAYRAGAAGYIQKPVDFNEFKEYVELLINYWSKVNTFVSDLSEGEV